MFNPITSFVKELLERFTLLSDRITKLETTEPFHSGVHAYMNTNSVDVLSLAGYTTLTFDTEDWDTDDYFTAGGSVFTVPRAGRYLVSYYILFTYTAGPFAAPWLSTRFRINVNSGALYFESYALDPLLYDVIGGLYSQSIVEWQKNVILDLEAGDSLIIQVSNLSATDAVVAGTGGGEKFSTPWLEIEYLGD